MADTPVEALFARAMLRCTACGAEGACGCWEPCSCGWTNRAGEFCRNPCSTRCTGKLLYGQYNRRTRCYEAKR